MDETATAQIQQDAKTNTGKTQSQEKTLTKVHRRSLIFILLKLIIILAAAGFSLYLFYKYKTFNKVIEREPLYQINSNSNLNEAAKE